jgi:hypothetical protein
VRYVIIHEASPAHLRSLPHPRERPRVDGLRYIGGDRVAALYRITAAPSKYTTYASAGFSIPEGEWPNSQRWLSDNGAKLLILGSCAPCSGTLEFSSGTFARNRVLAVRDAQGRVAYRGTIVAKAKRIRISLRFSQRMELSFATDPPPDQINKVIGGEDTRKVAVYITQVRFRPDRPPEPRR